MDLVETHVIFMEKILENKKVRFDRTCARFNLFKRQINLGNPIINHAKYSQYFMNGTYSLTFHLKKYHVQNVWSNLTFLFLNVFSQKLNVRLNEIHLVIKCMIRPSYWFLVRHEICDLLSTYGGRLVQRMDILLCCVTWLLNRHAFIHTAVENLGILIFLFQLVI